MKPFAGLLERLVFTPSRNGKLRHLQRYFAETPDPDRGWALAALTDGFERKYATPSLVRPLIEARADPVLFRLSHDYVGDLAETVSLMWPGPAEAARENAPLALSDVIETVREARRKEVPALIAGWLDRLDPSARFALLKLLMGGMRVGVSARLAKTALARYGGIDLDRIEEMWFGLSPPYTDLFRWLDGTGPAPAVDDRLMFRPMMLATPLEGEDVARLDAGAHAAEWKWDGIRVQLAAHDGQARLYSRTGDEIGGSFPEIAGAADFDAVVDGELLVVAAGEVRPFNDLQQRLGRKSVTRRMLADYPAHLRAYDLLFEGGEDLRALPLDARRDRLAALIARENKSWLDLSPEVPFASWDDLARLRGDARAAGIEGLMLKRRDSTYQAGRPKGPWFKWKRDPLTADCVLMYAQRGHGKRSSFYSDFTFGVWRGEEVVPVGKAYFGFTDAELRQLDKWVRDHTIDRFGPVRAVSFGLVLEIAFDSIQRSNRHKSGLAMRFPRVARIRWDKPVAEAERIETLEALVERAAPDLVAQ
ncbi:cisplatin damage response ATP-dependent DNA ligase [Marivibrio halodurans]|uniref:DNA ligase (ATP) n=1 Tax=Marivibrio halodurans TaxID=2039722 RepID=A0A8J7SKT9_9PROT|nr:cisplatin damage response ATP-dependent DNA ligase [Marivibrio halodurans]